VRLVWDTHPKVRLAAVDRLAEEPYAPKQALGLSQLPVAVLAQRLLVPALAVRQSTCAPLVPREGRDASGQYGREGRDKSS
jgi:hypothetical protein